MPILAQVRLMRIYIGVLVLLLGLMQWGADVPDFTAAAAQDTWLFSSATDPNGEAEQSAPIENAEATRQSNRDHTLRFRELGNLPPQPSIAWHGYAILALTAAGIYKLVAHRARPVFLERYPMHAFW